MLGIAVTVFVAAGLWSWGYPAGVVPSDLGSIFEAPSGTSGSMDKSSVRGVIRQHINEVKGCYEAALVTDPTLFGRLMVQFTIAASGDVISSVLQSSTLHSPAMETCAVEAVKRWRFPRPKGGGIVIISYPFVLVPPTDTVLVPGSNGANRVEVRPISADVVLHVSSNETAIPSNGLIAITEHGLVLIDTAWTPSETEAILRWGDERLKQPWIGAVITHDHADRDGGLGALARRRIPVSAIDLTVEKLQKRGIRGVTTLFSARTGDVYLKDDRGFEAFYPGPGHASDNIVVRFDSLLFGGCLIKSAEAQDLGFTGDAELKVWPAAVRRVQERYGNTTIVPGHGPIDETATGAAFENTLRLLEKKR